MLEAASLAIAVISLLVAIVALALGNKGNQSARYAFAGFFFALTVVFALIGVFALVGSNIGIGPSVQAGNPGQPTTATGAVTATPSASSTAPFPPSPTSIPPTQMTAPPTPTLPAQNDMDSLFGAGNWFCFPDREDGVGVKKLSANFTVRSPLRYVDTWLGRFQLGETTTQAAGATAELDTRLPRSECPSFQQEALAAWTSARSSDTQPFNRARFDGVFGSGNWTCLPDYSFGVKITYLSSPLAVVYPFTAVDVEDSTRYGVGETAPSGGRATVWLGGSIPQDQCPP